MTTQVWVMVKVCLPTSIKLATELYAPFALGNITYSVSKTTKGGGGDFLEWEKHRFSILLGIQEAMELSTELVTRGISAHLLVP